ncbi:hypothetical protein SLEP1_g28107 [Rubroshorea leprosula]|uniref:Uncharacterized protein n=1 Tax=Rubroshorea leprosula TaxID=152421 RepID=A0AAV5JSQ4_9ROSI|nr:hypothetical protein SLEP1_g28107 [Rubroshorea leprosula]
MEFFREVGELRGNQGMEEEEGVMSVEPIVMIVPPELQDLPKTPTPESNASSSAHEGSGDNHSSPSEGSSSERTPNAGKDVGEGVSSPLQESMEVNVDVPMVAVRDTCEGNCVQIALLVSVEYHSNDVDTQIERVSNDLATRLSRWHLGHTYMNYPMITPDNLELKDRITNYVKAEGLVDLEALVTLRCSLCTGLWMLQTCSVKPPEAPRSSSQKEQGSSSASQPHAECRVEAVSVETWRCAREDSDAEDDVPLIWCRLNSGSQFGMVCSPDVPTAPACDTAEALPTPAPSMGPRITYPKGFSYTKADCQLAMALSYSVALFESEQVARGQNCELSDTCKRLTSDKVSLEDEVNRPQSSEMANKAASSESRADELANKVNQLKEELEKVQAEKESGIQAAMDKVIHAVDRTKKAEAERDNALNNLSTLRQRVAMADQDLAHVEKGLRKAKT